MMQMDSDLIECLKMSLIEGFNILKQGSSMGVVIVPSGYPENIN